MVSIPQYYFGLTPRFIVGACQVPIGQKFKSADEDNKITKEIFYEMRSYNDNGLIVTSNQCNIHSGPVMQLTEAEWTDKAIGISYDEIWNRYGDEIISGDFNISKNEMAILKTIFG